MKRIGYLYEKIYDYDNIIKAIDNASRGGRKKKKKSVQKVLANKDYYAREIQKMLRDQTYVPSPAYHKTIQDGASGKMRDISIPKFYPDQIIHWALVQVLQEPVFMKGMYPYSCGSVPKRGGAAAHKYVRKALRDPSIQYVLKADIRKFYPTIDHDVLKSQLRRRIKDHKCLGLLDQIIDLEPGLPIGFYTSQWLANFYLQNFDHFIKNCGARYYVRYVDDLVILGRDKPSLHKIRAAAQEDLVNDFSQQLKTNYQVYPVLCRPVNFVGYRIYRNYDKPRKPIIKRIHRTVRRIRNNGMTHRRARKLISSSGWYRNKLLIIILVLAQKRERRI